MKYQLFAPLLTGFALALGATAAMNQSSMEQNNKYFCAFLNSTPTTFVRTPRGNISMIRWVSYSTPDWQPVRRCQEVSARFQRFYDNDTLKSIGTGTVSNLPVLCAVRYSGDSCNNDNLLLTPPPGTDRQEALNKLLDLRALAAGRTIDMSGGKLATYVNGESYVNLEELLQIAPVEEGNIEPVE
jgi:hypothetical protein